MLLLARDTIRNNCGGDEINLDLMAVVSRTLQRLETFLLVSAEESKDDVNAWVRFSRASMLDECRGFLSAGRIDAAQLVWDRHRSEFNVNGATVEEMLAILPATWDVEVVSNLHGKLLYFFFVLKHLLKIIIVAHEVAVKVHT